MSERLPIIVLAGSDSRPGHIPDGMQRDSMLTGPKGTLRLRNGRYLVAELVARIRASRCFDEPLLLGPRDRYDGKVDCEIIHVEGALVHTLRQLAPRCRTVSTDNGPARSPRATFSRRSRICNC